MAQKQEEEEMLPPLSPISEILSTSIMPLNIIVVFESETRASDNQIVEFLRDKFIKFNDRLSSVIHIDNKGIRRWKKVDVAVDNHVIFPTFPVGLSRAEYDKQFQNYLSQLAFEPFREGQPLWEMHIIKYPTLHGAMAGVFRVSHAVGDGYSIMSVACSTFERADNPSIPVTFPNLSLNMKGMKSSYLGFISKCINTVLDLGSMTLKSTVLKDQPSAIRSMNPAVKYAATEVSSITISLNQVKQIKSKIGGTVNDVVTGLIYYTLHLYMMKMGKHSKGISITSKMIFNTRFLKGYKSIDEMLKEGVWGNYAGFLQIPIPIFSDLEKVDPLDFITKAKENTDRMKSSMVGYLFFNILSIVKSIKGLQAAADFIHSGFVNTSTTITNVIGPNEKMAFMGHPINNFYYFVAGIPQSIVFTIVSYNGQIKMVTTTEKNFIDSKLLVSCMNEAFEKTYETICGDVPQVFN